MIVINLVRAKSIAHNIRRGLRAAEFAPFDEAISKQLPGTNLAELEAAREAIRIKYSAMQIALDAASTVDELKTTLGA